MKTKTADGFTVVEILVVIAIIAVSAAILLPVTAHMKASAKKTSCASNMHQLGLALTLYASDADDKHPVGKTPSTLFGVQVNAGMGWAGRVFPYSRTTGVFHCPSDATNNGTKDARTGAIPAAVSYGLNLNVSATPVLGEATSPSNTVWLFEVKGNLAEIALPDEGLSALNLETDQLSAIGDGTQGSILSGVKPWTGAGSGVLTSYATGRMDNADATGADDYLGQPGRHSKGANFMAADTHSVWARASNVSAGGNARTPATEQAPKGCSQLSSNTFIWPCAEGTQVGKRKLTFSMK